MSEQRRAITAEGAPAAIGPYSHAVATGGLLFCSGQVALDPASGELVGDTAGEQARRALENLEAVCTAAGTALAEAIRVTVYLTDMGTFAEVNEVYGGVLLRRAARAGCDRRGGAPQGRGRRDRRGRGADRAGLTVREPGPDDVEHARGAIADVVRRTPVLPSATLTERAGGEVVLKAESLQRTGSFKIRGALNKLAALGEKGCANGVVAASAGNHAQALAHAARARGVPCEVFMPREAPIAKVEGAEGLGAKVIVGGSNVDECLVAARERAEETGMALVHPFDDPDVVAGQGTLGLELLEDVPDLKKVVVPVGGGGLVSGLAIAVKSARPEVEVVGVQVAAPLSIADGIAVKHLGELTSRLIDRWVDELLVVPEDDIAEAMVMLMEKAKLVVEGAGAVGAAALVGGGTAAGREGDHGRGPLGRQRRRRAACARSRAATRRSRAGAWSLFTRVSDRPGTLARLLALVGEQGANILEVQHVREGVDLHVRETAVQLVLETRGREHAQRVLEAIAAAGYETGPLG